MNSYVVTCSAFGIPPVLAVFETHIFLLHARPQLSCVIVASGELGQMMKGLKSLSSPLTASPAYEDGRHGRIRATTDLLLVGTCRHEAHHVRVFAEDGTHLCTPVHLYTCPRGASS